MRTIAKATFLGVAIQLFFLLSAIFVLLLENDLGMVGSLTVTIFLVSIMTLCMVFLYPISKVFDQIRPKFHGAIFYVCAMTGFVIFVCVNSLGYSSTQAIDNALAFFFITATIVFSIPLTMLSELLFGGLFERTKLNYAAVEKELGDNNIDNDLWSQALVKANGNEEMRKAVYIKLRAKQLQKIEDTK